MICDIIIKNGRVVDPYRNVDYVEHLCIKNGKIIYTGLSEEYSAKETIDAKGCVIFPGLIDFHTHIGWRGSEIGLAPDLFLLPNGVTAAVDAGTFGTCNYETMAHTIIPGSMVTIKSFLNITPTGIITEQQMENTNAKVFDRERLKWLLEEYGHQILGLKIRIGSMISDELGMKPLEDTIIIAEELGVPVCVHVADPKEPYDDILKVLRKGDIICHCFQHQGKHSILDEKEKILASAWEARKRGIMFDCAPGIVKKSLKVIRNAIAQGFYPDLIGTDIVSFTVYRPELFSLPLVMSDYMAAGMPLGEIVRAVTETPAKLMNLSGKAGTIQVGANADIAIMKIKEYNRAIRDIAGEEMQAHKLLVPQMTIKSGKIVYRNIEFI